MNIYEVRNGWYGESYVRVYVVAANKQRALDIARGQFRAHRSNEGYAEELEIELLYTVTGEEYVSQPSDDGWRK